MTNILHSAPVGNEEKGAIKSPRSEIVAYVSLYFFKEYLKNIFGIF